MITYKNYSSKKLFDLIHNYSYLKEIYKVKFNTSSVPAIYSQDIKDVLFRNYPNTHIFLALNENTPVAFLNGSYNKNNNCFTIEAVFASKRLSPAEQELIKGKLMLRAISHARVKEKTVNFAPSVFLSKEIKDIFKKIHTRKIDSKRLTYVPDKKFLSTKESFSIFKKDKVKTLKKK